MAIALLVGVSAHAQWFNFKATAPSGQTLYYKITDADKRQVAVVCPLNYNARERWRWEGYTKPSGSVTIPSTVWYNGTEYTVVKLNEAFYYCEELTSVTIPKTVVDIDVTSFEKCRNLASIQVQQGNPEYDSRNGCNAIIKSSNDMLVYGCKNTVIPNTVKIINWYAFRGSGLTSISIPPSVEYISSQAFYDCHLKEVTIPSTVKGVDAAAFDDDVTIRLEGSSLILERGMYHSDYDYDDEGYDYWFIVVPCGKKSLYEQSPWGKLFLFRENCE